MEGPVYTVLVSTFHTHSRNKGFESSLSDGNGVLLVHSAVISSKSHVTHENSWFNGIIPLGFFFPWQFPMSFEVAPLNILARGSCVGSWLSVHSVHTNPDWPLGGRKWGSGRSHGPKLSAPVNSIDFAAFCTFNKVCLWALTSLLLAMVSVMAKKRKKKERKQKA